MISLVFIILANLWIWKIFSFNFFIALIVIISSYLLLISFRDGKIKPLLAIFFIILIVFQFLKTERTGLLDLSQREKLFQIQRMKEYPPVNFKLGNRIVWIPMAHWLEERKETLFFYRIQKNVADILSPNLYFFSNHPNERVEFKEFEKFPYLLVPFFFLGIIALNYRKNIKSIFFVLIIPVILFSLIGQKNPLGPILMFPFISVASYLGLIKSYDYLKKVKIIPLKLFVISFWIIYCLVLFQTFLYGRS